MRQLEQCPTILNQAYNLPGCEKSRVPHRLQPRPKSTLKAQIAEQDQLGDAAHQDFDASGALKVKSAALRDEVVKFLGKVRAA